MPSQLVGKELRCFSVLNQFNFIFGIFYTIYQIFMTIFQGFNIVFTIFIFLFCAALLITSGCSNRLKNSDSGLCMFIALSLGVTAWVIILLVIVFVNGIGNFWSIIVTVCWFLLLLSLLFVLYLAVKLKRGGPTNRYQQMV